MKARDGYVASQYKLAKKRERQENAADAFYWMKEAAVGRYPAAMRDLAVYYATGYGLNGEPDMTNATKYLKNYAKLSPKESKEVLEMMRTFFDNANPEERLPALHFLNDLLILERGQHFSKSILIQIAKEMHREMNILGQYYLEHKDYQTTRDVVLYCLKIAPYQEDVFDNDFYRDANAILDQATF